MQARKELQRVEAKKALPMPKRKMQTGKHSAKQMWKFLDIVKIAICKIYCNIKRKML